MAVTRVVNTSVKAKNFLTRFGREKNSLYKQMEKAGYVNILERNLKNGSTVTTANKAGTTETIAFMLHPDLTMEQKTISKSTVLVPWNEKRINIEKVFTDSKGDATKIKSLNIRKVNGKNVERDFAENNLKERKITRKHFKQYGGALPQDVKIKVPSADVVRSTEKINGSNSYYLLEHSNGARTYIKDVNGQTYTFTSK